MMFTEEMNAGETAVSYTDDFVDAAVAKLDSVFGKGYAQGNPDALAAYVAACASNLNAFMIASTAMSDGLIDAMAEFEGFEEDFPPAPAPKSAKKRGR